MAMRGKARGWDGSWPDESVPRTCRRDVRMGGFPKDRYISREEAEAHVGPGENAYDCPNCKFWHVGHKRGRKR